MKNQVIIFVFASLLVTLSACQKVINVNLKDSTSQYVIEGELTDAAGSATLTISKSIDFQVDNNFPPVSNALVVIRDSITGVTDTLKEGVAGTYSHPTLQGILGHTYQLTVVADGKTFTSSSTIPTKAVMIDSLYAEHSDFNGKDIYMVPVYTDPVGTGNNYRLRQWINGVEVKGSAARNDDAVDGQTASFPLFYSTDKDDGNPLIHEGDTLLAELQCTDKNVYNYFRTLAETIDQNSATPANPITNITGGALGYFNACTSRKKQAIAVY